jgi:pyruvate formate lyase activating enzyme
MLDVKAWAPEVFRRLTGASQAMVRKNLTLLADGGKLAELRVVCLPGVVDAEAALAGIASLLTARQRAITPLKLIRFRPNGVRGELASQTPPSLSYMEVLAALARAAGFACIQVV